MASANPADLIMGVDLGGTKILAAVVGPGQRIIGRHKRRTKAKKGTEKVLQRIVEAVNGALDDADLSISEVQAVGVGIPGPTDSTTGIVHEAPNLGWQETPVARRLSDELGVPVYVGNDTNLCTLGEYDFGAGRGARSVIGAFVGTGLGGGVILDGELLDGATQAAGEIGHMIIQVDGPKCGCGRFGCVEALASRLAIEREIRADLARGRKSLITELLAKKAGADADIDDRRIRSQMLKKAYVAGDEVTRRHIDRSADLVGVALAGAVHLINPERIIIGGGVAEAIGQPYVDRVDRAIRAHTFPISHRHLQVVAAELGDDAGVLGAVSLVRRRLATAPSVAAGAEA